MQYAACAVPAAPVYKSGSHTGEMTNQLLFGEAMEVLEDTDRIWIKVKSCYDHYEGWVTKRQVEMIDPSLATARSNWMISDMLAVISVNGAPMNIPFGAFLAGYANGSGHFGGLKYKYDGANALQRSELVANAAILRGLAMKWLNAPYLWGGKTILGVDCSGFAQVIFKMMGIDLLRDARLQVTQGEAIGFLQEARCGDLAFFDDADGAIVHVGILLSDHEIIHASGKVRIDKIDNQGIVNTDTGLRTHQLRIIKRHFI